MCCSLFLLKNCMPSICVLHNYIRRLKCVSHKTNLSRLKYCIRCMRYATVEPGLNHPARHWILEIIVKCCSHSKLWGSIRYNKDSWRRCYPPGNYVSSEMSKSFHDEAGISRYNCEAENQSTQERKLITRQAPGASRIYAEVCIFCEKVAKYKKGSRSREPLIQYCDVRVDDFIRATAIAKGDARITAIVSRELVAAEACMLSIDHVTVKIFGRIKWLAHIAHIATIQVPRTMKAMLRISIGT